MDFRRPMNFREVAQSSGGFKATPPIGARPFNSNSRDFTARNDQPNEKNRSPGGFNQMPRSQNQGFGGFSNPTQGGFIPQSQYFQNGQNRNLFQQNADQMETEPQNPGTKFQKHQKNKPQVKSINFRPQSQTQGGFTSAIPTNDTFRPVPFGADSFSANNQMSSQKKSQGGFKSVSQVAQQPFGEMRGQQKNQRNENPRKAFNQPEGAFQGGFRSGVPNRKDAFQERMEEDREISDIQEPKRVKNDFKNNKPENKNNEGFGFKKFLKPRIKQEPDEEEEEEERPVKTENRKKIFRENIKREERPIMPRRQIKKEEIDEDKEEIDTSNEEIKSRNKALATFRRLKNKPKTEEIIIQEKAVRNSQKPEKPKKLEVEEKPKKIKIAPQRNMNEGGIFMCSAEEANQREQAHTIHLFEMAPGLDLTIDPPSVHLPWTVKEYLRANSGLSESVRNEEALGKVLDYLFTNILDVDTNGNPLNYTYPPNSSSHSFKEIYEFISDRSRAVAKDYRILDTIGSDSFIRDHERIARFFIMSCSEGFNSPDFDLKLNMDRARDILTSLMKAYKKKRSQHISCENEAEFMTYLMVLNLSKYIEVIALLKEATNKIRKQPIFQIGLKICMAYYTNNYCEYFELMKNAPYLVTCVAYASIDNMRITALEMMQNCSKEISIEDMTKYLWFSDEEETIEYLEHRGIVVDYDNGSELDLKDVEITETAFRPTQEQKNIAERRNEMFSSRLEIIENSEIRVQGRQEDTEEDEEEEEEEEEGEEEEEEVKEEIEEPKTIKTVTSPREIPAKAPVLEKKESIIHAEPSNLLRNAASTTEAAAKSIEIPKLVFRVPEVPVNLPFSQPPLFSTPLQLPISTTPLVSEIKATPISQQTFVPKLSSSENTESFPILPKKHSRTWKFPQTSEEILSLCESKEEKEEFKREIKEFRKNKKIKKMIREKQAFVARLLLRFVHWKRYVRMKKFKIYVKERMEEEKNRFLSQFSKCVIDDTQAMLRYSEMKRRKLDTTQMVI
ncbi:unnamed protein product [Blepharisma stoltei]|uniref:SAC3/GANP/THP3 conserved domain-containing protein n=1 Tax=Blepharisma stoltei TaxID=1481888 RepID=A0AAU9J5V2_9CILI|nr:unnamed protein product [Blepharisma stoltei]